MTTAKPGNGVSEEGFLARWSHRKQQADSEESIAQADQPLAVAQDAAEPLPTDADMPPLDSLTEESDYSGFLSPKVSDELRKLALRKLFQSARFNLRDGLDDYDEDFTSFAKLGDIVTAEMRRRLELEEQRSRDAAATIDGEQPRAAPAPEQIAASGDEGDTESIDESSNEPGQPKEAPET